MTHNTRDELKKAWIDAWEYHDDRPEHQAAWWLNHLDQQLQKAREEERMQIEKVFEDGIQTKNFNLEDSVFLARLLTKAFKKN